MKKRSGSDEGLDSYFMRKFKELGIDLDVPRKRRAKTGDNAEKI
jgi:hypothetical protein